MGVILGIDIGGSSTKIVGLHENGTVIDMLRVKAEDPLTSLYGALGNFLATHSLKLTDIGHIALTGVGASYVDGDIYGVRTVKVEEFPSVGVGGLALSRKERAVVVSMGTGTSLLWAEKGGEIRHIIGSGIGGGNDEREQTLNQLLAEMDGFDPGKGIIVLAATNRPEVLDQALLRPGRFDRRITIDRPNLAGRIATLEVHTRNIKLGEDVDLKKVALATAGCVGADLANIVNEAALRAVRKGRKLVTQEDMLAAFEFVIAGSEKKNSCLLYTSPSPRD